MRGPAGKNELLAAVRAAVGDDAYSETTSAAEHALKNDRHALQEHLGIEIVFDRSTQEYCLGDLAATPWLDLGEEDLAAIATIYNIFEGAGPESARVRSFLDRVSGLLPPGRAEAIQRRRGTLTIELRELDETPIPPRVMRVVQQAVTERRRLGFHYRAAIQADQQPRYHEVEPYGIVLKRGHYYLECFDLFSRSQEHGRVTQEQPRDLRLQGMLDDEMLRVLPEKLPPGRRRTKRVRFRYRLAPLAMGHGVSRHFTDMEVERQPDGSAIVTATTDDAWEAVYTLLSYGEDCVVLEGGEVLNAMRGRVAEMARNYGLLAMEMG